MAGQQSLAKTIRRAAEMEVRYQNRIVQQRKSIDRLLKDRELLIGAIQSHIEICSRAGEPERLRKVLDKVAGD